MIRESAPYDSIYQLTRNLLAGDSISYKYVTPGTDPEHLARGYRVPPGGGSIPLVYFDDDSIVNAMGFENMGANNYPADFMLYQNYPNPFNPSTTISFSIPRSTYTTLKIFNTIGQEIATLVSDNLNPGTYSKQWNATNVASGVYFYKLQVGDFVQTKKLLLLR